MRYYIVGGLLKDSPETSWRWVFACGLLPAIVAFLIRMFIKEPEKWQAATEGGKASPKISELFTPALRRATLGGMAMALVAMITWWSCNTFASVIASQMANAAAQAQKLDKPATQALVESWKSIALTSFCTGGLIGTLLTVPIAKFLGRRAMFAIYFILGAASIIGTFAFPWEGATRLYGYFPIGLTIFGVFGSFTYYLPELFPTRLRGTGAGFTYNIGRIIAAAGPFMVGLIAQQGLEAAFKALVIVGYVPIIGLFFLPFIVETKGRSLEALDE